MNHLENQDTGTSEVPSVIEFDLCDNMDDDTDKEYDLADGDWNIQGYETNQDSDAMKRMINEMLQNPGVLYQSPVYSKGVVPPFNGTLAIHPTNRAHSSHVTSQISPRAEFQETNFLRRVRRYAFDTPTTQNATLYFQERNSSPVSPTKINAQIDALSLLSRLPPLPFC